MEDEDVARYRGNIAGRTGIKHICPPEWITFREEWLDGYSSGRSQHVVEIQLIEKGVITEEQLEERAKREGGVDGINHLCLSDMPGIYKGRKAEQIYIEAWKKYANGRK